MKKYVAVFSIIAVVAVVAVAIAITPAFTNAITTSYKSEGDVVYSGPIDIQDELTTNDSYQAGEEAYSAEVTEQSNNNGIIISEQSNTVKSTTLMDNEVNYEDGVITSVTPDFKANGTSYTPGYNSGSYNITKIEAGVFRNCKNLVEVDLSDHVNLKTIGEEAFYGCDNLKVIKLPAGITEIGSQAFGNTKWLKDRISEATQTVTIVQPDQRIKYEMTGLVIVDGIVVDGHSATGTMTITYTDVTKEPVVVNNILLIDKYQLAPTDTNYLDVTKISRNAFSYNKKVQQIGLSDRISDIPYRAFSNCSALQSINIPGVKTIGNYAFDNCDALTNVGEINVDMVSIGLGAFRGCDALETIDLSQIYSGTHFFTIGNQAFMDCTALDIIYLPRNIKTIGVSAFMGCTSLRRVYFDANAEGVTLSQSVFKDCTRLRIVDIAKAVTDIPNYTFANCTRLDPNAEENMVDPERYSGSGVYALNKNNVTVGAAGNGTVTLYTGAAPADIYAKETSADLTTLDILLKNENGVSLGLLAGFDPAQTSYEVSTIYSKVYISATSESNIAIEVDNVPVDNYQVTLGDSAKTIKITTTTNKGTEKEYTLTITKIDTKFSEILLKASEDAQDYGSIDVDKYVVIENGQYVANVVIVDEDIPSLYIVVPGVDLDSEAEDEQNGKTLTFVNNAASITFTVGENPGIVYVINFTKVDEPIGD